MNSKPQPKGKKGKRKKSRTAILHKKAWDIFSLWIRNRDKKCITCGSTKALQAGHFWHACLDFDEININAQCRGCNHFRHGNLAKYSTYLIEKYGIGAFNNLQIRHYQALKGEKRSEDDYMEIIKRYIINQQV